MFLENKASSEPLMPGQTEGNEKVQISKQDCENYWKLDNSAFAEKIPYMPTELQHKKIKIRH